MRQSVMSIARRQCLLMEESLLTVLWMVTTTRLNKFCLQKTMLSDRRNKYCPRCIEDIRSYLIDAVYRLRETGKPDILSATNEFVAKHECPIISHVAD